MSEKIERGGREEEKREYEAWMSWSKFSGPTAFNKVSLDVEYNILVLTCLEGRVRKRRKRKTKKINK